MHKRSKDEFDEMGIILRQGRFLYGWKHGWLVWAPHWVRDLVVSIWNPIGCRLWGHDIIDSIKEGTEETLPDGTVMKYKGHPRVCIHCCKEWEEL